jgi:hypothetical protein
LKTHLVDDLGEDERAERRHFAGLEDHRTSRCERRSHLRGDLVQRIVPRRDAADDADRLLDHRRIADLLFERVTRGGLRRDAEAQRRKARLDHRAERDRHPDFARDYLRDLGRSGRERRLDLL